MAAHVLNPADQSLANYIATVITAILGVLLYGLWLYITTPRLDPDLSEIQKQVAYISSSAPRLYPGYREFKINLRRVSSTANYEWRAALCAAKFCGELELLLRDMSAHHPSRSAALGHLRYKMELLMEEQERKTGYVLTLCHVNKLRLVDGGHEDSMEWLFER